MKILKTLLFGFLGAASLAAGAESMFESFETGLPSYAKASRSAGIKVSADHYKLGQKSLQWNWKRGSGSEAALIRHKGE